MEYSENAIHTPQDIGPVIRALRQDRKITGSGLGERAGLSQSKISKIETGATIASPKELKAILNILACPKTIQQRIVTVCELSDNTPEAKYRAPVYPPYAIFKREHAATNLKYAITHMIPALLQTTAYREALFSRTTLAANEFTLRLNETEKRQNLLWDKTHTFHFVIHEAALYTTPGDYNIQCAQLDRLERLCEVKNIKIGILALEAGLPILESPSSFVIYDNRLVVFILGSRELESDDPQVISENLKVFKELSQKASYGTDAKDLIRKAMDFFS
jgi:transcriptional regulator with XRE-family HTH domain